MNIFTTENIAKYNTKGATAGIGEYTLRNGYWSMDIRPAPFWQNYETSKSTLLKDDFLPNTQYIIDLWIDGDDVIYNGSNVACGLQLYYTDGTSNASAVITGGNKGFQHVQYVTNQNLSIDRLGVYYYVSQPVYYRADSFITPLYNTTAINKTGIINSGEIKEQSILTNNFSTKLGKGYINANNIIEI